MRNIDLVKEIRQLAKSDYYQSLFSLSKEHPNLRIFENDINFSTLQMLFLKYLNFYFNIHTDIALGDVSEIVLENSIREDAYMMYKTKIEKNKFNKKQVQPNTNDKYTTVPTTSWIFKNPPKTGK